jgi:hypothetical protein
VIPRLTTCLMFWFIATVPASAQEPKIQLKDGDCVVLIGNTFIERDRHYGQIETMLRSRFSGVKFTMRNLAWPGDTTTVQLRPLNFQNLDELLAELKPAYLFVSFGTNEAFKGPQGIEEYLRGYRTYLDRLAKSRGKIIMISSIRHENLGPPLPDPSAQNDNLRLYVEATRKLAAERGYLFVNLFATVVRPGSGVPAQPLTENGIHLTEQCYEVAAEAIARQLLLGPTKLPPEQRQEMRREIIRKELLFFNRWRAHNGEYIYGRRSKAGGGNAGNPTFPAEMAEFERLIRETEAKITEMSCPK